jgi:hypothetical protein
MTPTVTVKVFGVKEALKELKELDGDRRKMINKQAAEIAKPATDAIKAAYPTQYLSGMSRKWTERGRQKFPYDQNKARKGVSLKVDTGKRNTSTIRIQQMDPAASIIDMAGKAGGANPQGARFVSLLELQFGPASRVMWPEYLKRGQEVERNMFELVKELMDAVNKRLVQ